MKSLTIMRHGKAKRGEDWPIDFDRPLAKRGQKDIERVVQLLSELKPPVDWIISSPARRAYQTAENVAKGLGLSDSIVTNDTIYEEGSEGVLALLGRTPTEVQHVLLIGHNPTLEQLVSGLCAGSPSRLGSSLPTSGVANIELQIMWWEQIRWGSGILKMYVRPKILRSL
jgi:phosphohistidine phosphatase